MACVALHLGALLSGMRGAIGFTVVLLAASPALAQVTINLRALDQMPRAAMPMHPPTVPFDHHRHSAARGRHRILARQATEPKSPLRETATAAAPMARAKPRSQPATASVVPPAAAKPPTMAAEPPKPVVGVIPAARPPAASSGTQAAAAPRTLTVDFTPGGSALAPSGANAVAALVRAVRPSAGTTFEVAAHAPEVKGDASAARRRSLDRALAVRAALIADGVPAANVYMRAVGAPPPGSAARADRATITVMGANAGAVAAAAPTNQARPP